MAFDSGAFDSGAFDTVAVIPSVALALSANVAAAAATATTARLLAPATKTLSDFAAGKISDDTNPIISTIPLDDYSEFAWVIRTQAPAVATEVYEFRVVVDGVALNEYLVTPQLTVSGGAGVPLAVLMHSHMIQQGML